MPKCDGCGADIKWIQLDTQVKMPCNADLKIVVVQYKDLPDWITRLLPSNVIERGFVISGRESHFAACPKAQEFRRLRRKKTKAECDCKEDLKAASAK